MVRPLMRSITTTSIWRCRGIPRSRSCRDCWRSPSSRAPRAAKSSPPLSPATRPRVGSAPRCSPDITISASTPLPLWAALAPPRPVPGCSASIPRRPRRRSASPGTMCKPFHAGKAAHNGLLAARLAARGFSSRTDIVECVQGFALTHGPDFAPAAALATPEGGFHLLANLFKYHAACYFTHAPIECARRLRQEHGLSPEMIARITLRIDTSCDRVCNIATPVDGLQSKFSLGQTVAMALAGVDTASLGAYSVENARDPGLVALRERIGFDWQNNWPQTRAELELDLAEAPFCSSRSRDPCPRHCRARRAPRRQVRRVGRTGARGAAHPRTARDDLRSGQPRSHRQPHAPRRRGVTVLPQGTVRR
ncbi:MAG: MmgE/PrpD family protein [Alphaproteobacteria bacterium]|nr:MAG: MmgE/PrpD family protein [Alphaproteobacteria bacterium]